MPLADKTPKASLAPTPSDAHCPAHLPTERMVISPDLLALPPGLDGLAGTVLVIVGMGAMAAAVAAASGESSTSGHFFWLQRVQLGPERRARPCTVCRWCWCRQMGGSCGRRGSLLGETHGQKGGWEGQSRVPPAPAHITSDYPMGSPPASAQTPCGT